MWDGCLWPVTNKQNTAFSKYLRLLFTKRNIWEISHNYMSWTKATSNFAFQIDLKYLTIKIQYVFLAIMFNKNKTTYTFCLSEPLFLVFLW